MQWCFFLYDSPVDAVLPAFFYCFSFPLIILYYKLLCDWSANINKLPFSLSSWIVSKKILKHRQVLWKWEILAQLFVLCEFKQWLWCPVSLCAASGFHVQVLWRVLTWSVFVYCIKLHQQYGSIEHNLAEWWNKAFLCILMPFLWSSLHLFRL